MNASAMPDVPAWTRTGERSVEDADRRDLAGLPTHGDRGRCRAHQAGDEQGDGGVDEVVQGRRCRRGRVERADRGGDERE